MTLISITSAAAFHNPDRARVQSARHQIAHALA